MPTFTAKLADLTIDGRFERPAFAAFTQQPVLEAMYRVVAPLGCELNNITFGQVGTLAERNIYFGLPLLSGGVKLTVGRLEVGLNDLLKLNYEVVDKVVTACYGAAQQSLGVKVANYTVTLNVHGLVDGINGREFVRPFFSKEPKGLGAMYSTGAVFYVGAQERYSNMALVLDASTLVDGGLFVRVVFNLDASKTQVSELVQVGREITKQALASVELQTPALEG